MLLRKGFFSALRKTDRQEICWVEGYTWSGEISKKNEKANSDEVETSFLN
jgi:hypothetical protein